MPDGVYILLTGRNTTTDKLSNRYIKKVNSLILSEPIFRIKADSEKYKGFLSYYLHKRKMPLELENELISMSEGRIIGINMLTDLISSDKSLIVTALDSLNGMKNIVFCFLSALDRTYGETKQYRFHLLLTILSVVGSYEPLSLREIADLLMMTTIKIELLEQMSDLAPLISVERMTTIKNIEYYDANRYHFHNEDIEEYVQEYLGEELQTYVHDIMELVKSSIGSVSPFVIQGVLVAAAHNLEIKKYVANQNIFDAVFYCNLYSFLKKYIANQDEITTVERKHYMLAMKSICKVWDSLGDDSKRIFFETYFNAFLESNRYGNPIEFERISSEYYSSLKNETEKLIQLCDEYSNNELDKNNFLANLYSFQASNYRLLKNTNDCNKCYQISINYIESNMEDSSISTLRTRALGFSDYAAFLIETENKEKIIEVISMLRKAVKINEMLNEKGLIKKNNDFYIPVLTYASILDDTGKFNISEKYYVGIRMQINKWLNENKGRQIPSSALTFYSYALIHYCNYTKNREMTKKLLEEFSYYIKEYSCSVISEIGAHEYLIRTSTFYNTFKDILDKYQMDEAKRACKELFIHSVECCDLLPDEGDYCNEKLNLLITVSEIMFLLKIDVDPFVHIYKGLSLLEKICIKEGYKSEACIRIGGEYLICVRMMRESGLYNQKEMNTILDKSISWISRVFEENHDIILYLRGAHNVLNNTVPKFWSGVQKGIDYDYVSLDILCPYQNKTINKSRIRRDDPCPCGSKKKYINCCGSHHENIMPDSDFDKLDSDLLYNAVMIKGITGIRNAIINNGHGVILPRDDHMIYVYSLDKKIRIKHYDVHVYYFAIIIYEKEEKEKYIALVTPSQTSSKSAIVSSEGKCSEKYKWLKIFYRNSRYLREYYD